MAAGPLSPFSKAISIDAVASKVACSNLRTDDPPQRDRVNTRWLPHHPHAGQTRLRAFPCTAWSYAAARRRNDTERGECRARAKRRRTARPACEAASDEPRHVTVGAIPSPTISPASADAKPHAQPGLILQPDPLRSDRRCRVVGQQPVTRRSQRRRHPFPAGTGRIHRDQAVQSQRVSSAVVIAQGVVRREVNGRLVGPGGTTPNPRRAVAAAEGRGPGFGQTATLGVVGHLVAMLAAAECLPLGVASVARYQYSRLR